jgi:hypothetical protein
MSYKPFLVDRGEAIHLLGTDARHFDQLVEERRIVGVQLFPDEPVRYRPEDLYALVSEQAWFGTAG